MKVEDLEKIEIIPNEKGGVQLFINGEKMDLKDTTDIHLDLSHDEDGRMIFELSARKRLCFLNADAKE